MKRNATPGIIIKRIALIILAMALLGLPVACSTEKGLVSPVTDVPKPSDLPTFGVSDAQPLQEIVLRHGREPGKGFNPLFLRDDVTRAVMSLCFEPLLRNDGTGTLESVLAESVTSDEASRVWTVTMRECVFHDGSLVTARDAANSLRIWVETHFGHLIPIGNATEPTETHPATNPKTTTSDRDQQTEVPSTIPSKETLSLVREYPMGDLPEYEHVSGLYAICDERYANIESIDVISDKCFRIKLYEPDIALAELLVFPVLKTEETAVRQAEILQGTGPYRMRDLNEKNELILEAVRETARVRRVRAIYCCDVFEATRLFETGEIDLLFFSPEEAAVFAGRKGVRSQSVPSYELVSLLIPDEDLRHELKGVAVSESAFSRMAEPFEAWPFPFCAGDGRVKKHGLNDQPAENMPPVSWPEFNDPSGTDGEGHLVREPINYKETYVMVVPTNAYPGKIVDTLTSLCLRLGYHLDIRVLDGFDYREALREGTFDIAMINDRACCFFDPLDYIAALETFDKDWNQSYLEPSYLAAMHQSRKERAERVDQADEWPPFSSDLIRYLDETLPVMVVTAPAAWLWYSNEIEGALTGDIMNPYFGLEELLIWSF